MFTDVLLDVNRNLLNINLLRLDAASKSDLPREGGWVSLQRAATAWSPTGLTASIVPRERIIICKRRQRFVGAASWMNPVTGCFREAAAPAGAKLPPWSYSMGHKKGGEGSWFPILNTEDVFRMGHRARRGDQPERWINSGQLRVGDRLLTMDGNWRAIVAIALVDHEETVYNFTVAKDHDYFVGETGFLVHNQNCFCNPGQELHHIVPENMPGFEPALGVLDRAGMGVNDLGNLMPIDYFLHRRIHTDAYRNWVNNTLRDAECLGDDIPSTLSGIGNAINNGTGVF